MYLKRKNREKLNEMSLRCFGVKSRWQKLINKGQVYVVQQKPLITVVRYYTLKDVYKAMLIGIKNVEKKDDL